MNIQKMIRKLVQSDSLFDEEKSSVTEVIKKNKVFHQNIAEVINEFHFEFISSKNYKPSITLVLALLISFFLIVLFIFNPVLIAVNQIFGENILIYIPISNSLSYSLTVIFLILSVVLMVEIYGKIRKKIFSKYQGLLSKNELLIYEFKYRKKNMSAIQNFWIESKFKNRSYLEVAQEVSDWQKIKNDHQITKKTDIVTLARMFINPDSTPRILTLVVAVFSLVTLLISKSLTPEIIFFNISEYYFQILILLMKLGVALFILGYEIYYFSDDILVLVDDLLNDYFENNISTTDFRVNRFIQVLLKLHTLEVNNIED